MLVEFTVGNYRSFREPQTLNMEATSLKSAPKYSALDENVIFDEGKLKLLSSAAIYGANASGKSNFVRAWKFFQKQVSDSARESQVGDTINVEPFAFSQVERQKPSFFEIVFVNDNRRYRYGFEADSWHIHREWLFRYDRTEVNLFFREGEEIKINRNSFKEGYGLESRVRENALFLSVVAQFNGEIATSILTWLNNAKVVSGLEDRDYKSFTLLLMQYSKTFGSQISNFIGSLDVNIRNLGLADHGQLSLFDIEPDLNVENVRSSGQRAQETIKTTHTIYNAANSEAGTVEFDIAQESAGTQKMIYFAGLLLLSLEQGMVLFVDELDARLHPLMTCEIIKLFNDKKTNPNGAQLIFTTHDTNLLANHLFRRDQIWFVEKDDFQASFLYSLAEFVDEEGNKVRNDASLERDYISGRFGAIPFIGDLKKIVGEAVEVVKEKV